MRKDEGLTDEEADRSLEIASATVERVQGGLRDALEGEGDFEVVGSAKDGVEAVRMAQSVVPEVIVMDVMMPHKDGVDACREIMELSPVKRYAASSLSLL